jgi:hypothetical protein
MDDEYWPDEPSISIEELSGMLMTVGEAWEARPSKTWDAESSDPIKDLREMARRMEDAYGAAAQPIAQELHRWHSHFSYYRGSTVDKSVPLPSRQMETLEDIAKGVPYKAPRHDPNKGVSKKKQHQRQRRGRR